MSTPRDTSDDVLVNPPLERDNIKFMALARNGDRTADVTDLRKVDSPGLVALPVGQPAGYRRHPASESAAQPWPKGARADQDRSDEGAPRFVEFEFHVIDLADEPSIGVDHLAVQ
jgi:hypothetical protein